MAEVTIESLKQDLDILKNDLEVLAKNLKTMTEEEVNKRFESAKKELSLDELKKSIDSLKLRGKEAFEDAKYSGQDVLICAKEQVIKDPLNSLAITFGAGFILGWLFRR